MSVLIHQEKWSEAADWLEKLSDRDPDNLNVWNNLATCQTNAHEVKILEI